MMLDGVYLTEADTQINSLNINRMEQRLIRMGQYSYFRKDNKELKIDKKIFEEKIFKKNDISLLSNPFFKSLRRSAVICERSNQMKDVYYLLEMKIGKITINKHPLFSEEDTVSSQLRLKVDEYRKLIDKALIPHLNEILQTLRVEDEKTSNDPRSSESDIALIRKQIEDTRKVIGQEQKQIQGVMDEAYKLWKQLREVRDSNKYTSTPFDLKIQEYVT